MLDHSFNNKIGPLLMRSDKKAAPTENIPSEHCDNLMLSSPV